MKSRRLLVTGSGGIGGVNFIRAIRLAEKQLGEKIFIVGTDYNPFHILFAELDVRYRTPKHSDPAFISTLVELCKRYEVEFLHPHPSVEAKVIAENLKTFMNIGVKTYLPSPQAIAPDKLYVHEVLSKHGVPTPRTVHVRSLDDVDRAFEKLGSPLWVRARCGAGGRLSLKVNTPEEAKMWIKLNVLQGRASIDDFILQEYLSGRDLAFDSLWYEGKLVTSYARERLEYPFKHISLSGITGTPSVARIIFDERVNKVGIAAVKALDPKPHGFYSVDMKENDSGEPVVTEVDGKWHTTAPLWGYAFAKIFNNPYLNLAYLYLKLGYSEEIPDLPRTNLFPEDYYLIRQMDCGIILMHKDKVWRVV